MSEHTHDDAALTAFALGEMEDASQAERTGMETRLEACGECRRLLAGIREQAGILGKEMAPGLVSGLDASRKRVLERRLAAPMVRPVFLHAAKAAGLLLVLGVGAKLALQPPHGSPRAASESRTLNLSPALLSIQPQTEGPASPPVLSLEIQDCIETLQASGGRIAACGEIHPCDTANGGMGLGLLSIVEGVESEGLPGNTEAYDRIRDNPFLKALENPRSTFSADVDTASYSNVRRFLHDGYLPPKDAVRVEEMVNYFRYDYPKAEAGRPFSVTVEASSCPWAPKHRLVRVGLKGREIDISKRPPSNLVYLIDVSGSMNETAKLPLLKRSLALLVEKLEERDRVAIVVYAGNEGLALPSTACDAEGRKAVLACLDRLGAGGSTNGGAGITLAYATAAENFVKGGTNRVIWCTDGDLNVGVTDQGGLTRLVEEKAKTGVFLTSLGFGTGNLKDSTLEQMADKGNGHYAYVDSLNEGKKVLVEEMASTLMTIAKDVKFQVEFNSAKVSSYRLVGYENRMLRKEDFNDDSKDAGEIGSGHTVTAFYEVVPPGMEADASPVDPLKYTKPVEAVAKKDASPELLTVKLRWKEPAAEKSELMEVPFTDNGQGYEKASGDFRFAAAVASFGMLLRDSEHQGRASYDSLIERIASEDMGRDEGGYRTEFVELVKKARDLAAKETRP